MELKNKIVNVLGDSITQGIGTSGPDAGFVRLIERDAGLLRANNYGISGTRIARQSTFGGGDASDLDFCLRCTKMDKAADINIVFGGSNDYGHGDAPFGTFADRTPETFYGACHYLMHTLLTEYPDAVNVICTPLHRLKENKPHIDTATGEELALSRYVSAIREVAECYALPVLDLWAMSGIQPNVPANRERYAPDGLHPSDAGNRLLADRILGFLKAL